MAKKNPKQPTTISLDSLSDDVKSKIGKTVVEDYKEDLSSRSGFDELNQEAYKLFCGIRDRGSIPHLENPSNVTVPLITTAALQFQARAFDSLVPGGTIVTAVSTDGKAEDAAKRVTKHINWQLTEEMEYWVEEMDKTLLMLPILGNSFKKVYRDFATGKNISELLSSEEIVINYGVKRIDKAERITHVIRLSKSDLIKRQNSGAFHDVDALFGNSDSENIGTQNENTTTQDVVQEGQGLTDPNYAPKKRTILEQHTSMDLNDDGINEDYIIWVDEETAKVLNIVENKYQDPITGDDKKLQFFIHYYLIPNPESLYGFGFGLLLKHLNEATSTIVNELIDAGCLANAQTGFINERSDIKKKEITFRRGEFKTVSSRSDDIHKDIYMMDFKQPSQALFNLLGLLYQYGKEISSISDAMIGKLPPSDTTATSFMAVLEQGLKLFSVIHKRIHRTFKKEVKSLFILNSVYLDERIYFTVQDSTSKEFETIMSGRLDYVNNIDIIPISDPTIISKAEQAAKALKIYEIVMSNPLTQGNQQVIYEATSNLLRAMETQNMQKFLPDLSTLQPTEFTPVEENARFMQELSSPVLPTQNHQEHLVTHQEFIESQFGEMLKPNGKNIFNAHIQETWAMVYTQSQQQQQQQQNQGLMI